MPFSPSSSVTALAAPAVVPKDGSKNQMLGRNLPQSAASTPPLMMGISIDSPLRLSVIVMLSVTPSPTLGWVPSDGGRPGIGRRMEHGRRVLPVGGGPHAATSI